MSVDKFGRYFKKQKGLIGPKGEGFNLTPEGDYDIQKKRLRNVWDPTDDYDAVNFQTHSRAFLNCITRQNGTFDAQNTRITNISSPMEDTDAITKQYFDLRSLPRDELKKVYSLHHYRLEDIAEPRNNGDAVNLNFVKNNTLLKTDDGVLDAKGCLIQNIASPKSANDAVNISYMKENVLVKNDKGSFNAGETTIGGLAPPNADGDAVNKAYFDKHTPIRGGLAWNFRNKRLSQVAMPTHPHDAVTMKYLQEHSIKYDTDQHWDVGNKRLKNLPKPVGLNDAVNKQYLKEALADLAFTLYKQINKGKRTSITEDKLGWDVQVVQGLATWDELFT